MREMEAALSMALTGPGNTATILTTEEMLARLLENTDYRELLINYLSYVIRCNGNTMLTEPERTSWSGLELFSAEEWGELKRLEKLAGG